MDESKTRFGIMLKKGRMERHWTQERLAEELNVSLPYLGDLERHKSTPSLKLFCKAIQLLNLSADDYVYPERKDNNTTYKQLQHLISRCDEQKLQVLLATAMALVESDQETGSDIGILSDDGSEKSEEACLE